MPDHNNRQKSPGDTTPAPVRLARTEDGRTVVALDGASCPVQVSSCFPWSAPGTFLSLRDDAGHEVALIPSVDDLDEESRRILVQALRDSAFAFEITHVALVKKEFEIRHWEVTCVEGTRVFQTRMDDWPRPLPPHGLLVTDVAGDVYVIPDWTVLDKHSRRQLAMFVE
jgi:hypothetical protein